MANVEKFDELRTVRGVHWDMEMSAVSEVAARDRPSARPAILFDEIVDYPKGHRVLIDSVVTLRRLAITMDFDPDIPRTEFAPKLRERLNVLKLIPPRVVADGPVMENAVEGKDVDLWSIPAPKWHTGDGGRYIGSGSVTVTQDPDSSWVNLGTYRIMVHDENTLSFHISPARHGALHRDKMFAKREPLKVAVSFGHDPLLMVAGSTPIPAGVGEYDWCGGIRGEPIEVMKGPHTGLPIPATAEIVVEGLSYPDDLRPEGPYGEWHGYYAGSSRQVPTVKVTNVMFRRDPIMLGLPLLNPRVGALEFPSMIREAVALDYMSKAGIPEVKAIHFHEAAGGLMFTIVAIRQRYAGHSRHVARVLTSSSVNAYMGRYTIVVDDDINPYDMNEVVWALGTRSDPQNAIEILTKCLTGPLDPAIRPGPNGEKVFNSRAIIDACRPWDWLKEFPPAVETPPDLVAAARRKFGDQLGIKSRAASPRAAE
jgi:4-hydroxy-3-polyprenylbenzoate decarboxylase